jgi:NADP-dependent 3-hydroxy acid dehydrogenase YdfG
VDLAGKTAIVTGASSGIGAATVRKLREAGVKVVGGARRVERIEADLALPLDVTDEESSAAFVGRAVAELGGVDILYNNAGLALGRYPFTESTEEDEATVLHTNVDGALRITRLCLPHIRDGGHILFTGSVAGRQAYANAASYVAAKFGLRGFVYGLREDLLGRPIRITTVDAGLTETEFSLVRFRGDAEAAKAVYEGVDPLRPEDVADCVLFAITRPSHVNVDEIVVKALAQSSGGRIVRREAEA